MISTEKLLRELTEADGVSGYEKEVREIIRRYVEKFGKITTDKMGSLICEINGSVDRPRLMLAGHMDEIGFMVKHITSEGFIRFTPLGGWADQVLLAQRVKIKTNKGDVVGIIGAKPPHLMPQEERKKLIEKKNMYIDIGATSSEEVEKIGVRAGDPVIPLSNFQKLSPQETYVSKAFDDRVGCAAIISALDQLKEKNLPNSIYATFTVQEEVGVRGAKTSAEIVNPDVAIILESDIAGDVPGIKPHESSTKLGGGPSLLIYDARMIPNLKLRDLVIEVAKKKNIPLQITAMEGGATDGSIIHIHKQGVPTIVLGVPTRHIHSHNSVIKKVDFENTVKLLTAIISELDETTVQGLTNM